jgi:hypothetical protein
LREAFAPYGPGQSEHPQKPKPTLDVLVQHVHFARLPEHCHVAVRLCRIVAAVDGNACKKWNWLIELDSGLVKKVQLI